MKNNILKWTFVLSIMLSSLFFGTCIYADEVLVADFVASNYSSATSSSSSSWIQSGSSDLYVAKATVDPSSTKSYSPSGVTGFFSMDGETSSSGGIRLPAVDFNNGGRVVIKWGCEKSKRAISTRNLTISSTIGTDSVYKDQSTLEEVSYTVSNNGETKIEISSNGSKIYIFEILVYTNPKGPVVEKFGLTGITSDALNIDTNAGTINLTVPYETDLTQSYVPVFTLATGTSFVTASDETTAKNFSSSVSYDFTDGSIQKTYTVNVTKAAPSTICNLKTFSLDINGEIRDGTIDATNKSISLKLPYSYENDVTKKSAIKTNFTFEDDKATASLTSGENQDYSSSNTIPDFITITAQDGVTKNSYSLNISYEDAETGKSIETFSFGVGKSVISETDGTINVTVSGATDVTKLIPTITLSSMATVSPQSGVEQDFTNPVSYTVTAENGDTKTYVVTVIKDNSAPTITSLTPADLATGVSLGGNVVIKFSENVILGKGSVTISDGTNIFTLVPNSISSDGSTTVTLPFSGLSGLTNYKLTIPEGSFTDIYGNSVADNVTSFTTADGTLHSADLPYASKMDGSKFEIPAFIIGGVYDSIADTKAATTTQYGAYKLEAGESLTLTAGSAGSVDAIFYTKSPSGSYEITSPATTSTVSGSFDHYTNKGQEVSLDINSNNTTTVLFKNTGSTVLYVAFISVSKVGDSAITEQVANCK